MDTVNKDKAMHEWVMECPQLTDTPLFSWLNDVGGSCAVMQLPGEAQIVPLIDGGAVRHYDFALQVAFPLSDTTDDVNTDSMFTQRQWQDWIDEQETLGNYPDFGPKCFGYELENLSSDPELAQVHENGMATYQFFARIIYTEER
jgi:hypothetical protein